MLYILNIANIIKNVNENENENYYKGIVFPEENCCY